jgi:hypothetical protein
MSGDEMPEPLSRDDLTELAKGLRRILDAIARGELRASSGATNRLEGAWLAAETLAKGQILDVSEFLETDGPDVV